MIHKIRLDLIIQAATYRGGNASFLASMCDLAGHGRVVTIDVQPREVPKPPRITYLIGLSTSDEIVSTVKSEIRRGEKVMVILDSDHSKKHVLQELRLYAPLITKGSCLIAEDTNRGSNPVVAMKLRAHVTQSNTKRRLVRSTLERRGTTVTPPADSQHDRERLTKASK